LAAIAIYLVLLLPVCGLLLPSGGSLSFAADHLQYLCLAPLVALAAAVLVAIAGWLRSAPAIRAGRVVLAMVPAAILGTLTVMQIPIYSSETSLWTDTIDKDPSSGPAHNQYAMLLLRKGRPDLAADQLDYDTGQPVDVSFLLAQARVFLAGGRNAEAIRCLVAARKLQPADRNVAADLADAYSRDGHPEKAVEIYHDLLRNHPRDEQAHNNLGLILAEQGHLADAIEQYHQAIAANSRFIPARLNLSNALFATGDVTGAATQLQTVISIDPRNFVAFMNAGAMLGRLKDFPAAERMFHAAAQLDPLSAEAFNNLGIAQAAQGNVGEAVWNFDRAVQLKPNFDQARENRDNARRQLEASRK
jgi:tetratricopeptide (TPR) repeat protein